MHVLFIINNEIHMEYIHNMYNITTSLRKY